MKEDKREKETFSTIDAAIEYMYLYQVESVSQNLHGLQPHI